MEATTYYGVLWNMGYPALEDRVGFPFSTRDVWMREGGGMLGVAASDRLLRALLASSNPLAGEM